MAYDFKKGPEDFSWVTNEMFDEELLDILAGEQAEDLLRIPGIYEIVAEHYNNEVLINLQRHREEAEDNDKDELPVLHAGDWCPRCGCNALEETDDGLFCPGTVCDFRRVK